MKISGAIFDVDGTLLDSMGIWRDAGARYLETQGLAAEPDLAGILFPMTLEEGSAYLKEKYKLAVSEKEIQAGVIGVISDFYRHEVKTKPGVRQFLNNLRMNGVSMVAATTGDKELIECAFQRLNILTYFDKIFTCNELGTNKRSPYIYQTAADYMKTGVSETCVFEDVLFALQAAKSGGFKSVAVEDRESLKDKANIAAQADYYMTDFTDFEKFWEFILGE